MGRWAHPTDAHRGPLAEQRLANGNGEPDDTGPPALPVGAEERSRPGTPDPLRCRSVLLAHFAGRGSGVVDIPAWALAYGVFSGAIVTVLWSRSRHVGRPGPAAPAASVESSPVAGRAAARALLVVQALSFATFVALAAFAWFGPRSIAQNVAPLAIIGVIWSLGAWVALAVGPIWGPLSPFAIGGRLPRRADRSRPFRLAGAGRQASPGEGATVRSGRTRPSAHPLRERNRPERPLAEAPWWSPIPAFASYVIVWVAWVDGDQPRHLAIWLTAYGVALLVVAVRGGRRALADWDAFGAALDLAASIVHPRRFERSQHGPADRRRVGVLAALVMGAVGTNRATETAWFVRSIASRRAFEATAVALALVVLLTLVILALWRVVERLVERSREAPGLRPIASALAPIAASVLIAQGLTIGLVEAQNLVVLASDPLARGWNLFGTVFWEVSQQPLSPFVGGIVQAVVILAGHLAAIGAIGRGATARALDGTTSPRARNRAWTASLPAMGLVTVSGVVWTLLLLGR
jgi:hypothetical protein